MSRKSLLASNRVLIFHFSLLFSLSLPLISSSSSSPDDMFKEKRWDSKRMLSPGGMPSSHAAVVSVLAMAIGLQEGTGGSAFVQAMVLECIVMYDAFGVKLHTGYQAQLLNQIVCELPPEHPFSNMKPFRDSLGDTPL